MLKKGSIYLTELPFTDQKKSKIRPVVVLHHDVVYDDVIVMAISSVISRRPGQNTILISGSSDSFKETGLKKESVVLTNRIVTLNRRRLFHRLGQFSNQYLDEIGRNIVSIFQIGITNQTNPTNETNSTISIPYGRQTIDDDDVYAVVKTLRSDWLTTGPKVEEFEQAVADYVGAKHAVAVSSGTAALHAAMFALGVGLGDEVIVPSMTFAATANCVVYQGGTPVFADVDPDTLLLDPEQVEAKITSHTRAIIGVDYAGQPCDWDALREIADRHNLLLVDDGCHALGAEYKGRKVGTLADLNVSSFHPVKNITSGEGGMITTDNEDLATRMRLFRNHGISRKTLSAKRLTPSVGPWFYEMVNLGYNYRMTDFQSALGISQLQKLPKFLKRRREIAARYDEALKSIPGIEPLALRPDVISAKHQAPSSKNSTPCPMLHAPCSLHAYHLYVIRIDSNVPGIDRAALFTNLRENGIGVNVHYIPIHLHPFYREKFNTGPGLCPVAENAYEQIVSLPLFPGMSNQGINDVINAIQNIIDAYNSD